MQKVILVGRPNIGKSTIFNRIIGKKKAIVFDKPGVTRDCREERVEWAGLSFILTDTPGFFEARPRIEEAILESNVVLFVVDGTAGLDEHDKEIARFLRKKQKPVIVVVNKADQKKFDMSPFYHFGFDHVVGISAEHDIGFSGLYDDVAKFIIDEGKEVCQKKSRIAIMGRPNAGKSTLINTLIGQAKQLTGPQPGLTRESIAYDLEKYPLTLVDTPGIAKKTHDVLEKMMFEDAKKTMNFADGIIYLIYQEIMHQDLILIDEILKEGRCLLIALSQWDRLQNQNELLSEANYKFASKTKLIKLSSVKNIGVSTLLQLMTDLLEKSKQTISTGKLNRWLQSLKPPPSYVGRIKYITQTNTKPPKFAVFVNRLDPRLENYKRYILNQMLKDFDFQGIPVRIIFKVSRNPYVKSS